MRKIYINQVVCEQINLSLFVKKNELSLNMLISLILTNVLYKIK